MAIRFLHTADWHLGEAFGSFGDDAGARLRAQRLLTVRRLAELARDRQLDAVLVAGDVFEHQQVSAETIAGALGALEIFPGDWVLLPGNHDFAEEGSVWDRLRGLAPRRNIHLATTAAPIVICEEKLAILPAPLLRRHEVGDLTAGWAARETPPGAFRVGLAHGSVAGRLPEGAEVHNQIDENRAAEAHLDYLALGDWHGTQQINQRTWYSGTPEPNSFVENEKGGVLVVEIGAPGAAPQVERCATGGFQWHGIAAQLETRNEIEKLDRDLANLQPTDRQVVRLELRGSLSLPDLAYLEDRLIRWRGQMVTLEGKRAGLGVRADVDDFASVQPPGFVADAVESLRLLRQSGTTAEQQAAADALEILYLRCREQAVSA